MLVRSLVTLRDQERLYKSLRLTKPGEAAALVILTPALR